MENKIFHDKKTAPRVLVNANPDQRRQLNQTVSKKARVKKRRSDASTASTRHARPNRIMHSHQCLTLPIFWTVNQSSRSTLQACFFLFSSVLYGARAVVLGKKIVRPLQTISWNEPRTGVRF